MKKTVFGAKERITQTGLNSISTVQNANAATESRISHSPGLIEPSALTITSAGLVVTLSGSSFGTRFGSGVVAFNHGTVDGSLGTVPTVTLAAPTTGSETWYILASAGVVQNGAVEVYGPPLGHPDYDPSFTPYQLYNESYDTLIMSASLAPADNVTTFEVMRTTLTAGQTTITDLNIKNRLVSGTGPNQSWKSLALTTQASAAYTYIATMQSDGTLYKIAGEVTFTNTNGADNASYNIALRLESTLFSYSYTMDSLVGITPVYYTLAGLAAYQQTDNSVDLYLYTPANAASSSNALFNIVEVSGAGAPYIPASIGSATTTVPSGTLVLDTMDPTNFPLGNLAADTFVGQNISLYGTGISSINQLWVQSSFHSQGTSDLDSLIVNSTTSLGGELTPNANLVRTGQYMESANLLPNPTGAYGLTTWTNASGWAVTSDTAAGTSFSNSTVNTVTSALTSDDIVAPIAINAGGYLTLAALFTGTTGTTPTIGYEVYTTAWVSVIQIGGITGIASGTAIIPTGATKGRIVVNSGVLATGDSVGVSRIKLEGSPTATSVPTPFSDEASAGMSSAASLNAASGYTTLPGGLLLQWGITPVTSTQTFPSFPIAFSNTAYSVTATIQAIATVSVGTVTDTVFEISSNSATSYSAYWMAIGPA